MVLSCRFTNPVPRVHVCSWRRVRRLALAGQAIAGKLVTRMHVGCIVPARKAVLQVMFIWVTAQLQVYIISMHHVVASPSFRHFRMRSLRGYPVWTSLILPSFTVAITVHMQSIAVTSHYGAAESNARSACWGRWSRLRSNQLVRAYSGALAALAAINAAAPDTLAADSRTAYPDAKWHRHIIHVQCWQLYRCR